MAAATLAERCGLCLLDTGRRIRTLVHATPIARRAAAAQAALKPGGPLVLEVDRIAEELAIAALERLADEIGVRIHLIADPVRAQVMVLGRATRREVVYAVVDAIDGTMKVGGLGNDLAGGILRVVNDGAWSVAAALTEPTARPIEALRLEAFTIAAVVDGNPPCSPAHPEEVIALPAGMGPALFDMTGRAAVAAALRRAPRLYTTTNAILSQSVVYLDGFQAFDLATRQPGDDALAGALYGLLLDRHRGGAFDIVRQYGSLGALLRVLLGWRGERPWREAQGAGFVVINENVANLVPAVSIVTAAGGVSVDFAGEPLGRRRLVDGRCNAIHAANPALRDALLQIVRRGREFDAARSRG